MSNFYVVQGMAFGDEGKGHIVNYLTKKTKAGLVVRFNGGPQAAHNVIDGDIHHTFSSVGSGTLNGADTYLSRHVLIDLELLSEELSVLDKKGFNPNVYIEPQARIIIPYQRFANRAKESIRGDKRHGSVGLGIGECVADDINHDFVTFQEISSIALGTAHPTSEKTVYESVQKIRNRKLEEIDAMGGPTNEVSTRYYNMIKEIDPSHVIDDLILLIKYYLPNVQCKYLYSVYEMYFERPIIFEGAQGFLLDQDYGFSPYNTWSDCTFSNALDLIGGISSNKHNVVKIGVFRSYFTRHGPGPFPTETPRLSNIPKELHNGMHDYMGKFRVGGFDLTLAKYAARITSPTVLAVTHLDAFQDGKSGYMYEYEIKEHSTKFFSSVKAHELKMDSKLYFNKAVGFCDLLSRELNTPVMIGSFGNKPENVLL